MSARPAWVLLGGLLVAGCPGSPASRDGGPEDAGPRCGANVLFLVDDLPRMDPFWPELGARVPGFVSALIEAGVDARVAVAPTWDRIEVSWHRPCPCRPQSYFAMRSRADGCPDPIFDEGQPAWTEADAPDAANLLACAAVPFFNEIGAGCLCFVDTPLRFVRVLPPLCERVPLPYCDGFFRDDTLLALLLLTNQDDCEPPPGADEAHLDDGDHFFDMDDPRNYAEDGSSYEPCLWRFDELRPMDDFLDVVEGSHPQNVGFVLSVVAGSS